MHALQCTILWDLLPPSCMEVAKIQDGLKVWLHKHSGRRGWQLCVKCRQNSDPILDQL